MEQVTRKGFKHSSTGPADPAPLAYSHCAFMGCPFNSIAKVKTETGWANLCEQHYQSQHQRRAALYCEDRGLTTPQQMINHIRQLMNTPKDPRAWMKNPKSHLAKRMADEVRAIPAALEREAGQDDEERAA